MSGLSFHHAVAQTLWHGKLFHIDLNAQRIGKFDQDFRFGSEGIRDAFYVVKLLEELGLGRHAPLRRARLPHGVAGRRLGLRARLHAHVPDPPREGAALRRGRRDPGRACRTRRSAQLQRTDTRRRTDGRGHHRAAAPDAAASDLDALASQGYGHERLDQLVTELLLGVR